MDAEVVRIAILAHYSRRYQFHNLLLPKDRHDDLRARRFHREEIRGLLAQLIGIFARVVLKINFMDLSGLLAGSMTDPPARTVALKEATDMDKAIQGAINELSREFTTLFQRYNTLLNELSLLHTTEATLAATLPRIRFLEKLR